MEIIYSNDAKNISHVKGKKLPSEFTAQFKNMQKILPNFQMCAGWKAIQTED